MALQTAHGVPRRFAMADQQYGARDTSSCIFTHAILGRVCSQKVTGPSLVSDTFMSAPNWPHAPRMAEPRLLQKISNKRRPSAARQPA
jgi:hypothetical protein